MKNYKKEQYEKAISDEKEAIKLYENLFIATGGTFTIEGKMIQKILNEEKQHLQTLENFLSDKTDIWWFGL